MAAAGFICGFIGGFIYETCRPNDLSEIEVVSLVRQFTDNDKQVQHVIDTIHNPSFKKGDLQEAASKIKPGLGSVSQIWSLDRQIHLKLENKLFWQDLF